MYLHAQGGPNTIREQQKLFQAQKKATGNTHTARGMALNVFSLVVVGFLGTAVTLNTCRRLYWNIGKIPKAE